MVGQSLPVYFDDLSIEAQQKIEKMFGTTPERELWDLFPLVILQREAAPKEKKLCS